MSMANRPLNLMLLAWIVCSVGCGAGVKEFPVARAKGRVLCEGQPVPNVSVLFNPMSEGKSAVVGKQGYANSDDKGEFVLSTYGQNDGAVIGKHAVFVAVDGKNDCNCVINDRIEIMQVEVKKGEENSFDIVLTKTTGREPVVHRSSSDDDDND